MVGVGKLTVSAVTHSLRPANSFEEIECNSGVHISLPPFFY